MATSAQGSSLSRIPGGSYLIAVVATIVLITIASIALPVNNDYAVFLLDHSTKSFFGRIYPLTIQNLLYVMTAFGIAELWNRHQATRREEHYLSRTCCLRTTAQFCRSTISARSGARSQRLAHARTRSCPTCSTSASCSS